MEIKYDNEAEKHTFGKILGLAAAVVSEDKEIQALIEKIVTADKKKIKNAPDCIADPGACATYCELYGQCKYTLDSL